MCGGSSCHKLCPKKKWNSELEAKLTKLALRLSIFPRGFPLFYLRSFQYKSNYSPTQLHTEKRFLFPFAAVRSLIAKKHKQRNSKFGGVDLFHQLKWKILPIHLSRLLRWKRGSESDPASDGDVMFGAAFTVHVFLFSFFSILFFCIALENVFIIDITFGMKFAFQSK